MVHRWNAFLSPMLVVALAMLHGHRPAAQIADLELDAPRVVKAPAGSTTFVGFTATAGDFIHLHLETAARLGEPIVVDERQETVVSYPRLQAGRGVHILLKAPATGRLAVRVRIEAGSGPDPEVSVRLRARRSPTAEDTARLEASRLLIEALRQSSGGSAQGRRAALDLLAQSVTAWEAAHDILGLGDTWNRIGQIHFGLSQYKPSIDAHEKAAAYLDSIGDLRGKAEALGNAGTGYRASGNLLKARELHEASLAVARSLGDKRAEGFTLHNLGAVENGLGNLTQAVAHYERSLELKREVGEVVSQGVTLSNLATTLARLGDAAGATERRRQALEIRRAAGDQSGVAFDIMAIGLDLTARGQLDEGLEQLGEALATFQKLGDDRGQGFVLHNTATVYESAKDATTALRLFEEALPLRRKAGDPALLSTTLMRIGGIHLRQGERQKAGVELAEALALKQKANDRYGEAYVSELLAQLHALEGDRAKALTMANRALELSRAVSDPIGEATALHTLGLLMAGADASSGLETLRQALGIRERLRMHSVAASTRLAIARIERDLGRLGDAKRTLEPALTTVESLRGGVANQDLRSTFFAGHHEYFQVMVDLLMREHRQDPSAGRDREALDISERARARRLLDTLAEARVDLKQGSDPELLAAEQRLVRDIETTEAAIVNLLATQNQAGVAAAETRLRGQLQQLQDLRGRIRLRNPAYAAMTFPQPSALTRQQQELLGPDTAVVEFMLGDKASYRWTITGNAVSSAELPPAAEIDSAVSRLRKLLTMRQQLSQAGRAPADYRTRVAAADAEQAAAARDLSRILLSGIDLPPAIRRLVVVGDGSIETVPFAALPDPAAGRSRPRGLLARYELAQLPSLSALASLRAAARPPRTGAPAVAIIADPVFTADDPRLRGLAATPAAEPPGTNAAARAQLTPRGAADIYGRFERLRFSRAEAQAITALLPQRSVAAMDFDANRTTIASERFRGATVLHFATHALLHPRHSNLSGIVLSLVGPNGQPQDGFLRLNDLYNLELAADLVVLSACETALGAEIRGEGLQAMSRGFMYAGARRVVASLWQVDDRATALLMERFYTALLRERQAPAAALRTAMLAMSTHPRWSAPYYWAGFTLQGDW